MELECHTVFLLLGSNLGEKAVNLQNAIKLIEMEVGEIEKVSAIYKTAAWGNENQSYFLNVALQVNTKLTAEETLDIVLEIEQKLGRVRMEHWGERLIDIDILLYDDEIINDGTKLQIPHPQMQFRNFALMPLAEIAGEMIHPVLGLTIEDLSMQCLDLLQVERWER